MKLAASLALLLALAAPRSPSQAAAEVLELAWIPAVGRVEVALEGARTLSLDVEGGPGHVRKVVELAGLPETARVRQARVARWYQDGLVLAVALEQEGGTSYRYLGTRDLATCPPRGATTAELGAEGWRLSEPLFQAEGEPYRIVELHTSGDALEITFRRGWPGTPESGFDERVFADPCPPIGAAARDGGLFAVRGLEKLP